MNLSEIDAALAQLREADCFRDSIVGLWRSADGSALSGCPVESAQVLRQRNLHKAMTEPPGNQRYWTR